MTAAYPPEDWEVSGLPVPGVSPTLSPRPSDSPLVVIAWRPEALAWPQPGPVGGLASLYRSLGLPGLVAKDHIVEWMHVSFPARVGTVDRFENERRKLVNLVVAMSRGISLTKSGES